jgi:hypothetical protein
MSSFALVIVYAVKASTPFGAGEAPWLTSAQINDCTEVISYYF